MIFYFIQVISFT